LIHHIRLMPTSGLSFPLDSNEWKMWYNRTDTQSSIEAIIKAYNSNPIVFNIRKLNVDLSAKMIKVVFHWVKEHIGIHGNERTNELANQASKLSLSESIYDYYPITFAKNYYKFISMDKWKVLWKFSVNGSITKQYLSSVKERMNIKHLKSNFKLI
jgi:hypothetical protein